MLLLLLTSLTPDNIPGICCCLLSFQRPLNPLPSTHTLIQLIPELQFCFLFGGISLKSTQKSRTNLTFWINGPCLFKKIKRERRGKVRIAFAAGTIVVFGGEVQREQYNVIFCGLELEYLRRGYF